MLVLYSERFSYLAIKKKSECHRFISYRLFAENVCGFHLNLICVAVSQDRNFTGKRFLEIRSLII